MGNSESTGACGGISDNLCKISERMTCTGELRTVECNDVKEKKLLARRRRAGMSEKKDIRKLYGVYTNHI